MTQPLRTLILEDRASDADLMVRELRRAGFEPDWQRVQTEAEFVAALDSSLDVILADYRLPEFDGIQALRLVNQLQIDVPVILISGTLGDELAIECIKQGAADIVIKDRLPRLGQVVVRALDDRRRRLESRRAQDELRVAHARLVESEYRYKALFDNLLNGYAHCRMLFEEGRPVDFVYLEVNGAFAAETGLQDVVGRRVTEVIPGIAEAHPELFETYGRVARGGRPERFELHHQSLGRWMSIAAYHTTAEHFVTICDNITERRQAEAALRESQARLELATSASNIGPWDWNLETNKVYFSPEWKRQIGYAEGEIAGEYVEWEHRLHPEDRDRVLSAVREYITDPTAGYEVEFRLRHKDESYRWIQTRGMLMSDVSGRPVRMLGCHLDITEKRQLEAQLRQAQKLEAVGRLTGGVAHDFNNILSVILGYTTLLLEATDPSDPSHADLGEIHKGAERASHLTNQLLAFSRQQVLQPLELDLNAIIADVTPMLRRLIGEDIDLRTSLDPRLHRVRVDRSQMDQILMNLAANARDSMATGGQLTVETRNVRIAERQHGHLVPQGDYVELTVTDTGAGMDAETRERIFEPFFTTKPAGRGTGLGLATVHGIVKQSGGFVWVYSEPRHGTTFTIQLPRASMDPAEHSTGSDRRLPARTPGARGHTLLVVEDDAAIRRLARHFLTQAGYVVLDAGSAEEALEVVRSAGYIDLLVSDVIMPGRSGADLFTALSATRPGLRVVYMSGYTDDAVVHHGVLAGIPFLQKPFSRETLVAKVDAALA